MPNQTDIAIVGLAYRAPGVGRKGLWDYLAQAKSAWGRMPASRFDQEAFCTPGEDKPGCFKVEGANFLPDDVYSFDAAFFNMRAEEARNSDPQHRMMLECALEAAEDAGHSLLDLAGKNIGVYVACGSQEYAHRVAEDLHKTSAFTATGIAGCMYANRLSYFFDVHGPSVAIEAACASSCYATHQACQALRNGECNAAFVGASAICFSPNLWVTLEKMGALSAEGRCFSYDHKAAGFGRGEGGACLLIKRLDDAVQDGDPIHAVIRGTACNHCGRSEGITMPSRSAQEKLLWRVHAAAGLSPSETPVIEGHGTATPAGDPIEAGAFASVIAKDRTASNPLYIGSVKSNFGHLEGASGIIGIVKAILMVKHGIILPTAGFEKLNSRIEGKEKLRVAQTPTAWPQGEKRRALVTNFGFGGSNSAVLLEQAPQHVSNGANGLDSVNGVERMNGTNGTTKTNGINGTHGTNGVNSTNGLNGLNGLNGVATPSSSGHRLFVLSAKTEKSLVSYLSDFDEYLSAAPQSSAFFKDLSYTLGQRRTHHPYRVSVVADTLADLKDKLAAAKPKKGKARDIAFVFTGQGAQHAQMASGLRHYVAFANAIDQAEEYLRDMGAPWSLAEELDKPESDSRINDADVSQPACTAVQLALVELFKTWGVTPTTVTGHSSGEIAAAYAAGLITFRAAIATAYFRGQAAARLAGVQNRKGAMLALGVGYDEASSLIEQHAEGYATVGAINSPQSVTVSGDHSAIEKIHKAADEQGLFARRLKVALAYHSRHMEEVADYYLEAITPFYKDEPISLSEDGPRPVFVSSVTGRGAKQVTVDASYWVENLVRPVRFAEAIKGVFTPPRDKENVSTKVPSVVVEIGPHSALKNPIKQTVDLLRQRNDRSLASFVYLPSLVRGEPGNEALLALASGLFATGAPIRLEGINLTDKHNAKVLTGLPAYAWDKSTSYEIMPRTTRELLFPGEPYHPLLGRPTASTGGGERIYRQIFTLDEIPWIRDHNVSGTVVFPMTGYLSCAIEATRRAVSNPAAAFVIRDFHAVRSLEIEEEQKVDLTTKLRPASTGTGSFSSTTWAFEVMTWAESTGWATHCYGRIEPEAAGMTMESPTLRDALPLIHASDVEEHDIGQAYATTGKKGTRYGPAFRNTVKYLKGEGFTVIDQKLRDLGTSSSSQYGSPYSVDPPTLDGFLQGGGTFKEIDWTRLALMPNYVNRLRVSNNIPSGPDQRFCVVTRLLEYDSKGGRMLMSVAAFVRAPDGSLTPVAEWESVTFRSLVSGDYEGPDAALPVHWSWDPLPRIDLLASEDLYKRFPVSNLDESAIAHAIKMHKAACYYMGRALKDTASDDRSKLPDHLARFVVWASRVVARESIDAETEPTALLNDVRTGDAQGELLCAIGDVLTPILREEVQPLEVMLKDGLLTRHYEADVSNAQFSKLLGDIVCNLSDLEPNMRILEIGAGTAGTTLHVLKALSRETKDGSFLNYTFTDISSGFFENARTKLTDWSQRITYEKLDISRDPAEQGFSYQGYDLIIAANVLHATKNMAETMTHVRNLLKPKGKVVLLEANRHATVGLPFALLPGWWYAEDDYRDREEGPLLTTEAWNRLFLDTGFSGIDVLLQDRPGSDDQLLSVFSATRVGKPDESQQITVCGPFMDDEEVEFAQNIADSIQDNLGATAVIKPFAEVDPADDPYCIFVDSPRHCLLGEGDSISSDTFEAVRSFILNNTGLLWVVPEGGPPEAEIIKGMLRTVRLEYEPKPLLMFDRVPLDSAGIAAITKLARNIRDPEVAADEDHDYVWHDGQIHQNRMRERKEVKEQFAAEQNVPIRTVQNIWGGEGALELTMEAAGSPDSIYFRRTDVLQQPLGDNEIIIQVEAAGLSQRDLNTIFGTHSWTPPGFDGVGKVVKTGSAVAYLQQGDTVLFLSLEGSAFATYRKIPASHAGRVPARLSTTDAASMPVPYSIAVSALIHTARLRKGETVLIHSASGAVGQACIVIAQHLGARIFVTAGTKTKRELLHETFGIPKDQVFSSRTSQFRDSILCATGGKGVDVIVNSLNGELLQETWALAANFGRFVDIAGKDASQNSNLPMKPFERNVTFSTLDLRELAKHRPQELEEIFSEFVNLLQGGVAVPTSPIKTVPISQFAEGLRTLKSADHAGKVVVTLGKGEEVLAESALRPSEMELNSGSTYLITGGTHGIGLSLAYWLIENGARNVVVLGRSGGSRPEVQELLKKYEGTGVCVRALACDVGSRDELVQVLDSIRDMPPVRGVIHSALILNDKLLQNATHDDWQLITRPRIRGAWNLDELLPDLDFFVALSSFLGDSGNPGQSIYAGTASFYDAFSRYRNARGQNTLSVALPVVLDVGYVADHELEENLKVVLGGTLRIQDIYAIVKAGILGQSSPFINNGKVMAFKLHLHGQPLQEIPWKYFHPVLIKERLKSDRSKDEIAATRGADQAASWTAASDPLTGLTDALIVKVSAMTMIPQDEVEADAPLSAHGLDSLVSVELRNWIRRETAVELALTTITQAASLRALATHILSQLGNSRP